MYIYICVCECDVCVCARPCIRNLKLFIVK